MSDQERSELERLKQRQVRLEQELVQLSALLRGFEQRLDLSRTAEDRPEGKEPGNPKSEAAPKQGPPQMPSPAPKPIFIPQPPLPPVIARNSVPPSATEPRPPAGVTPLRLRLHDQAGETNFVKGVCQSCGGHLEFPASVAGDTIRCPHCGQSTVLSFGPGAIPVPPLVARPAAGVPSPGAGSHPPGGPAVRTPAPAGTGSFEMRLGTYWLVRIGIVMVLTALVFFGNLAYQNFGPSGKVSLLYLTSAALLGAGAWWQRKAAKESLKNYAQVLLAGGLAAVYFTTYAAHHIESLRVIESAGLDGELLLAWTAFMVWIADRKKSEVLALFAVGLAYYTSIITRVGLFTLYSNLLLTAAAVFFLVRNRWAALSGASLAATYTAYAFWRFFHGNAWHWASPDEGLWTGACFLISYWLLFTAAVFLSKDAKLAGPNRAAFLSLNNGAFFAGFVLTMLQVRHGGFWKFSLIYGAGLLVLAEAARRLIRAEPLAKNSYLTQGLVLVTVGFISKYSGMNLALILAVESVVLLMAGQQRKNGVLIVGAYLAAALAVGWGMDGMWQFDRPGVWLGAGLGALMLVNTLLAHRETVDRSQAGGLRGRPAYFTALALLIWLVVTWNNTRHENFPLVLSVEALLLTLSIYVVRVREIPLLSQGYLVLAQLVWVVNTVGGGPAPAWWRPVMLIVISLALSHWWQTQRVLPLRSQIGLVWQGLYALAMIGVFYAWLGPKNDLPAWLAVTSLLAVGITAYGVFTRAWLLAACGQIFMAVSLAQFAWQLAQGKPAWPLPLAPIAALGLLSFGTIRWFQVKPDASGRVSEPLLQIALLYRWTALAMSIWWVCEYIPPRERVWLLALLGLWIFLWAGLKRSREALLFSAPFTMMAMLLFWLPLLETPEAYWPNLIVIVVLLAQRQFARRLPDRYPVPSGVHTATIIIGGLSLWRFLSLWVLEQQPGGFYLTASWSLLALVLFAAGIALRERIYRWLGLSILACALGRVMIIDIWMLKQLYRILSFMALGIVLLVLGFIYNRYQEKIRQWL